MGRTKDKGIRPFSGGCIISFSNTNTNKEVPSIKGLYSDYTVSSGRWLWTMWNLINSVLMGFQGCFSRKAAFYSFVVIVIGFMLRSDLAGVSSVIRTLGLMPRGYEALVHFFVPPRGRSQPSGRNGCARSTHPVPYSWKVECLYSSETG